MTEAGFLTVPAQPTASQIPARLFYSFRPADADPAHAPLVLLFNGGPGSATTTMLLSHGTGPFTLDSSGDPTVPPEPNPASWTSFANLLYVDMRLTGFSYALGDPSDAASVFAFSPIEDASDFVRALLAFWDAHPSLVANPVILAGESYGGERAQYILDLVLRYRTEAAQGGSDLPALLQAHFDKVFPNAAGQAFDEATIARQFAGQVLIQPEVLGLEQIDLEGTLMQSDPYVGQDSPCFGTALCDGYDLLEPAWWSSWVEDAATLAISNETTAIALLGVSLARISGLAASQRKAAFDSTIAEEPGSSEPDGGTLEIEQANASLATLLGPLPNGGVYFVPEAPFEGSYTNDPVGTLFYENLAVVRTFITNARYDGAIYSPAIPAALAEEGYTVVVDEAPRSGVQRPGWFRVTMANGVIVEVRFPSYTESGHMVATTEGQHLHDDVVAWWTSGP